MRGRHTNALFPFALALAAPLLGSPGELRLKAPAGDGMVMQREATVPIQGWAAAGKEVRLTFGDRTHRARADENGRWRIDLPPHPAGGPYEMTVATAAEELQVRDLLVGDVWICSGQSNMEWAVERSLGGDAAMAAADDRWIRHYKVPRSWAVEPEEELAGGGWRAADPVHVGGFTGVGYFFARALRPRLDVPIGLINTSWGGSRIEAWMSAAALGLDAAGVRQVTLDEERRRREMLDSIEARVGGLPTTDGGLVDGEARWAAPGLDESSWHDIAVPAAWEAEGWEGLDGIAWYRTGFELTADQAAAGLRLGLGEIDDSDISWVNGHRVGGMEMAWNKARLYDVPPAALRPGRNVLAVRVEDTGAGGGIQGTPEQLFLEVDGERRSLAGGWKFQVGTVTFNPTDRQREIPMRLYNKMVHPLVGFPVKGVLWYQGESNAWPGAAFDYRSQFQAMIQDWRHSWGDDELPFLFVQLAAFLPPPEEPGESDWAVLRESQSAALALPATAQAVLIDAGDADDVHPRDKRIVGERLALAARSVAYGEELVFSGPAYAGHEVEGSRVVLRFDHLGAGLVAGTGDPAALGGFAVAGEDRRFVWAEAEIRGDQVFVWSDQVTQPVAVRYGWADNPETANLYNRDGLPASPFRTDNWPVETPAEAAP